MKLRISPSARSRAAATRRSPIECFAGLELRADAQEVHLRQRAEDVLHRSVVNVEHHLLQIALGRLQKAVRGRAVRRIGTGGRALGCRARMQAGGATSQWVPEVVACEALDTAEPSSAYAPSVSSLNGIAR